MRFFFAIPRNINLGEGWESKVGKFSHCGDGSPAAAAEAEEVVEIRQMEVEH